MYLLALDEIVQAYSLPTTGMSHTEKYLRMFREFFHQLDAILCEWLHSIVRVGQPRYFHDSLLFLCEHDSHDLGIFVRIGKKREKYIER